MRLDLLETIAVLAIVIGALFLATAIGAWTEYGIGHYLCQLVAGR